MDLGNDGFLETVLEKTELELTEQVCVSGSVVERAKQADLGGHLESGSASRTVLHRMDGLLESPVRL